MSVEYIDEEIAALGGQWTTLYCDECGLPFEVLDDIANEMIALKAQDGDPLVCHICSEDNEHFLKVIHIDKHAKHHRCPRCKDVILAMTDDHILCCPVSDILEIDADKLPINFDPEALPLKYCPPCRKDVALEEAEALLGGL